MGKGQENNAVSISNAGETSVGGRSNADKIKVSKHRFLLVGIYEGKNNGDLFWFNKETPISSTWVKLTYNYMQDGLSTGGYYNYYIAGADSIEH